jgi:hypothetical protein
MSGVRWAAAVAVLAGASLVGRADVITDATGDFLKTYKDSGRPLGGDLDVVSAGGTFDGSTFRLFATLAAPVGTTPPNAQTGEAPLYVWGINKGAGGERFVTGNPSIGAGVRFDAVATLTAAGVAGGTATSGLVNGKDIEVRIPLTALPSTGFAPADYTWNLWPRFGGGNNAQVADFAPDASNARFTLIGAAAVPEPSSAALLGAGGLAVVGWRWRRAGRTA